MIQRQFDVRSLTEERDRVERAVAEFYAYAHELLAARREDPGEDLISTLLAAEAEEGDRLSDVECVNLVLNALVGGVDTTQRPARARDRALRRASSHVGSGSRPSRASSPQAVEEVLRFEPITPFTARLVTEEIEHRGVIFPADTLVLVSAFTANRDLIDARREGPPLLRPQRRSRPREAADLRRRHPSLPRS